ncbi:hypothetical protein CYMTET_5545 [Cymbomonas tetramitiformis]|uniref:EGF-like domain-containing protein n=1 Tax=Cymbomonas tetramitiformis TaxID=36881 RepID=A0AAE0LIR9_9CHLO|nr:hypothetical protein CYMTET_5545 [Cymbomonas tetramitiformis]
MFKSHTPKNPGCVDNTTYIVRVLGTEYNCEGVVVALGRLGVNDCSTAAAVAEQAGLGSAFTPDMQEELVTSCPASCGASQCAGQAVAEAEEEVCEDDSVYTVRVLGTEYNCEGVVVALGGLGVNDCSTAAAVAEQAGLGSAFTPDMQEELVTSCPVSCSYCATGGSGVVPSPNEGPGTMENVSTTYRAERCHNSSILSLDPRVTAYCGVASGNIQTTIVLDFKTANNSCAAYMTSGLYNLDLTSLRLLDGIMDVTARTSGQPMWLRYVTLDGRSGLGTTAAYLNVRSSPFYSYLVNGESITNISKTCSGHGQCLYSNGDSGVCECDEGFIGTSCSKEALSVHKSVGPNSPEGIFTMADLLPHIERVSAETYEIVANVEEGIHSGAGNINLVMSNLLIGVVIRGHSTNDTRRRRRLDQAASAWDPEAMLDKLPEDALAGWVDYAEIGNVADIPELQTGESMYPSENEEWHPHPSTIFDCGFRGFFLAVRKGIRLTMERLQIQHCNHTHDTSTSQTGTGSAIIVAALVEGVFLRDMEIDASLSTFVVAYWEAEMRNMTPSQLEALSSADPPRLLGVKRSPPRGRMMLLIGQRLQLLERHCHG